MKPRDLRFKLLNFSTAQPFNSFPRFSFQLSAFRKIFAFLICVALFLLGQHLLIGQQPTPSASSQSQAMTTTTPTSTVSSSPTAEEAPKFTKDQLDSLVAPIALYPDPLLSQTLAASTYPLEVIQLYQWLGRNKKLKGKALVDAIAKQPWEPSVQSMAAYPDALQRMADNIQWATELGNAFLGQQQEVMDAVQRMRAKAKGKGTLEANWAQKVENKTEGGKDVIVIEPADPEVVYVPSYDVEYVYGPPVYPWYPYYYPGYGWWWWGAGAIIGGIWGGWWGDCDWGHGDCEVNPHNKFNRNGGGKWEHRPEHRGNTPYADRRTSDKFGDRAKQRPAREGAKRVSTRPSAGKGRPSKGTAATRPSGGAGTTRPSRGTAGTRPSTRPSGSGGSTRVGNRSVSSGPSYSNRGGTFGGSTSGYRTDFSSSRGGYSMGGGGFSRSGGFGGGGFGGGGFRGGGGGRRR